MPVLLFGSELWGISETLLIERFHMKFCRYVLGIHKTAPHPAIRGELGRNKLRVHRLIKCIKYWLYMLSLESSRYLRQCYDFQFKKAENGKECWALDIKNILYSYGFGEVWIAQGVENINYFVDIFSQRCKDIDFQNWHNEINTYTSLAFYSQIKQHLCVEDYLTCIDNKVYKTFLTKARIGILDLEYIRGIWFDIPPNERICRVCGTGEVEDLFHFVIKCPTYNIVRNNLLPDCVQNTQYLSTLFSSKNKYKIISLSKFIYRAYKIRQNVLPRD